LPASTEVPAWQAGNTVDGGFFMMKVWENMGEYERVWGYLAAVFRIRGQ